MLSANFTLFGPNANQQPTLPKAINIKPIPYIPPQIDLTNLKANGKLFDDNTIKQLKKNQIYGRLNKKDLKTDFNAYKDINGIYGICPGKKQKQDFGEGAFGRVKGAQNQQTKKFGALKTVAIQIPKTQDSYIQNLFQKQKEQLMGELNREYFNLLSVSQAITPPFSRESAGKGEWQLMMIMKIAEGVSLEKLTEPEFNHLPTLLWIQIILDVIDAVLELHKKYNMLHLDLKPANIFYHLADKKVTLVDFGFSSIKDDEGMVYSERPMGTPLYMNCRIREQWKKWTIEKKKLHNYQLVSLTKYDNKSDIFALGTTFAELCGLFYPPDTVKDFDPDNNYIAKKGHKLYDENCRITNPLLLEKMTNYFHLMTSKDESKIPALLSAKYFFQGMKIIALLNCPKIKVAFMNVDEYLNSNESGKKALISKLKNSTEIRIYDSIERDDMQYIQLKKELETHALIVGSSVAIAHDVSLIEQNITNILAKEYGGKFAGYFETELISNRINDNHYDDHKNYGYKSGL